MPQSEQEQLAPHSVSLRACLAPLLLLEEADHGVYQALVHMSGMLLVPSPGLLRARWRLLPAARQIVGGRAQQPAALALLVAGPGLLAAARQVLLRQLACLLQAGVSRGMRAAAVGPNLSTPWTPPQLSPPFC